MKWEERNSLTVSGNGKHNQAAPLSNSSNGLVAPVTGHGNALPWTKVFHALFVKYSCDSTMKVSSTETTTLSTGARGAKQHSRTSKQNTKKQRGSFTISTTLLQMAKDI